MVSWRISEAVHIGVTGLVPAVVLPVPENLHRRVDRNTIVRFEFRPHRTGFGLTAASAALSMCISNTATTMMLSPTAIAVVNQLAESADVRGIASVEPVSKVAQDVVGWVLLLGIAYAASIGGIGTIGGSPTTVAFPGVAADISPTCKPAVLPSGRWFRFRSSLGSCHCLGSTAAA